MNALEKYAAKKTLAKRLSKSLSSGNNAALLGGLGAGALAYAALRRFRPSASPMLRSLQQKAGKSYTVDYGSTTAPGAAGKLQGLLAGESLFKSEKPGAVLRHIGGTSP